MWKQDQLFCWEASPEFAGFVVTRLGQTHHHLPPGDGEDPALQDDHVQLSATQAGSYRVVGGRNQSEVV